MKFKTPKTFEAAGQVFTVRMDADIKEYADCCGQTHIDKALVIIDPNLATPDIQAITYYHELLHVILITIGRMDLNSDEAFIDNTASLLWQAQKTSTY